MREYFGSTQLYRPVPESNNVMNVLSLDLYLLYDLPNNNAQIVPWVPIYHSVVISLVSL